MLGEKLEQMISNDFTYEELVAESKEIDDKLYEKIFQHLT